ncbi:MAG: metallophosphoesterase [Deltaproteobacteria bacterium]|jgi:3',5'-cyclic AMP phosphodiesterase CpdA|nr:metallophosphoesterase [Deltaproteobacteria bacterium]
MSDKFKNLFPQTRRQFLTASTLSTVSLSMLSCSDTSTGNNSDAGVDADGDIHDGDIHDADIHDADIDGDGGDDSISPPPERPPTTVTVTVTGVLAATEQFEDLRHAFGKVEEGFGESHQLRNDLNAASVANGSTVSPSSLAYFCHMTDIHVVDEESPARSIHSPIAEASAWRPQECWSTHVLNGAIKTINQFAAVHPMDFIVFSGDLIDNKQNNEIQWFVDVLEGKLIDPDTGLDDDPLAPGLPDPHDPFQSDGLDPAVDWYAVQGNHDLLVLGNFDVMDFAVADPTGDSATFYISDYAQPTCLSEPPCPESYCYSDTPGRCNVPASDNYFDSSYAPPDADRYFTDRTEWIQRVMDADSNGPLGHGFSQANLDNNLSYWRVDEPVPGIPVAMLGLDTSSAGGVTATATGYISDDELQWLEDQLNDLVSLNKLVIIVSHHCSRDLGSKTDEFRNILNSCPNVVLHITGHHHQNEVMPRPAPSGMEPWYGYYEVQNCGLLDWPQQIRFWEITDNGDGTGIIYSTMVDIQMESGSVIEAARFYALLDVQEARTQGGAGDLEDRNVAFQVAWPPEMLSILANLPAREVETFHFMPEKKS